MVGALAGRVVVPADGVAGDAGSVQSGQRLGHRQALGIARVGRVEQVARLEEKVGAALERTGDRSLPALPQPGAAGFELARTEPVVVAPEVVVGGHHDAQRSWHWLVSPSCRKVSWTNTCSLEL